MDQQRWARLQDLFTQVVDLPEHERDEALNAGCGADQELRALVLKLLQDDAGEAPLLDAGVAHAARSVLGDPADRDRFGEFVVVRKIDEGGMGIVYLAERPDIKQRAAIKVLGDDWVSPAKRERFTLEQQALARLKHPSIATLFEANTLPDGTPYFVMEYVEGEHLTKHCTRRQLPIADRLRLFAACCEGVRHAHQHLIIHRDLKPSNIMVTADGTVKLLDFGIAKQLASEDAAVAQTRTFVPCTPEYAAPEQMRGGEVGVFTDVYSLGVILYELLTERLPFERTLAQARDGEMPTEAPLASLTARSAGRGSAASRSEWTDLDVICSTALHPVRERRYASVEALLRDCQHYLRSEPIEARPDSTMYRVRKFVARHRVSLSIATAAVAVLVALVTFYTWRLTAARNEALAQAAIRERVQGFMLRLFDAGETSAAPASGLLVTDMVDRGVREAGALDQDPRVQAELYLTLGQVYQRLGNMPEASASLRAAVRRQV